MAELVDALDSGSSRGNSVDVRVILAALKKLFTLAELVFCGFSRKSTNNFLINCGLKPTKTSSATLFVDELI